MSRQVNQLYEFGRFVLDPDEHLLLRDGEAVPLRPKVFDILLLLVENSGHLVEKDELLQNVWPGQFVEEGNLNKNISMLRQALGESPATHEFIETVPKRGYRFVAGVRRVQNGNAELIVEKHARTRVVFEEEKESDDQTESVVKWSQLSPNFQHLAATIRRHRHGLAVALGILLIAVIGTSFGIQRLSGIKRSDRSLNALATSLPEMRVSRLTFNGNVGPAAISPDAKYVAYISTNAGLQSIWLRQAETESTKQITNSESGFYHTLTFSHDGNYVYYTRSDEGDSVHALYRMPVLGGVPTKLIDDVFEDISLSPTDAQIAFVRKSRSEGDCALMVANADGSSERRIASRKLPDHYKSPSWSPDGEVVVCVTGNADKGGLKNNLVAVRAADGSERTITAHGWQWIKNVAWLPNSSDLLMTASDDTTRGSQIWLVSYVDGNVRGVTNDLNRYGGISLTSDSKTLATTLTSSVWNIWVAPVIDSNSSLSVKSKSAVDMVHAQQLTAASGGISWTPDGRLVYASYANGDQEVWIANADGSEQKQLTSGAGSKRTPIVSPDGRYIVFASDASGALHLWRMGIDGANPMQLTGGDGGENYPCFSADGRWVVFTQVKDWTLWRVPVDGGSPEQIVGSYSSAPSISPDGKLIGYYYREKQPNSKWRIAVGRFSGGPPLKVFDPQRSDFQSMSIRWAPDGRGVTYEAVNDGVSNIWSQSLDGGKPIQLTDFASDYISYFDWSADSKQLACIRGRWVQDLVLIRDFR